MSFIDPLVLVLADTADTMLSLFFELAEEAGLPVTSWRDGDPTITIAKWAARVMAAREGNAVEFVKAAWLSKAEGLWLTVLGSEVYGVDRVLASPSTPSVTLTNGGGGVYPLAPGELTVQCSATGVTFHSTSEGDLNPGDTRTFTLISDVDGAISTVTADEIDTIITSLEGVTIVSSTASVGTDEQSDPSLRAQCAATRGALSPNGPADAYEYVVRNFALTGTQEITRAKADPNASAATVTVYVATSSGAPSGGAVALAQAAVDTWAEPLCITATVLAATPQSQAVTLAVAGDGLPAGFAATIAAALPGLFAALDLGDGDNIVLSPSKIETLVHTLIPEARSVAVTVPAAPVVPVLGRVLTLGVVTATEG